MTRQRIGILLGTLIVFLTAIVAPAERLQAATGTAPYVGFRKQTTAPDFAGSTLTGVTVENRSGAAAITLDPQRLTIGRYNRSYGVKNYSYGTLVSPVFDALYPFDTAI